MNSGSKWQLRDSDSSVKLLVTLFLLMLGIGYVFAFLMVTEWVGLTPVEVIRVYQEPKSGEGIPTERPEESQVTVQPIDLAELEGAQYNVDTRLLIQDSHVHIVIYSLTAGLLSVIALGLSFPTALRNGIILSAFAGGTLDFAGLWLIKGGLPIASVLTLLGGWMMAAVYLVITGRGLYEMWWLPPRKHRNGKKEAFS